MPTPSSSPLHRRRPSRKRKPSRSLLRPLLMWGGLWMFVSLVAGVAIGGMISTNHTPAQPPSSPSLSSDGSGDSPMAPAPVHESEMDRRLPVWGFMALALTCAAGSMFVTEQLKNAEAKRNQPSPPPSSLPPPALSDADRGLAMLPPHLLIPSSQSQQPTIFQEKATIGSPSQEIVALAMVPSGLPEGHQMPQPRLAELLDLRKQRSLQELMTAKISRRQSR